MAHAELSKKTSMLLGLLTWPCQVQQCIAFVLGLDVCVGYHTRKITLPVMPLTVPVTLSIPEMSAARTGTVRPLILHFF